MVNIEIKVILEQKKIKEPPVLQVHKVLRVLKVIQEQLV